VTIQERAADLRTKKLAKEAAKEEFARCEQEFKEAQSDLMEYMDDNDVEGIKHDGINFVPVKTNYGQIDDRKAFIAWCEENDEELIEPKERKSVLNKRARQLLDDGEPFPPGMTFRTEEYISQRAAK
jgi:hypothetical protein